MRVADLLRQAQRHRDRADQCQHHGESDERDERLFVIPAHDFFFHNLPPVKVRASSILDDTMIKDALKLPYKQIKTELKLNQLFSTYWVFPI